MIKPVEKKKKSEKKRVSMKISREKGDKTR